MTLRFQQPVVERLKLGHSASPIERGDALISALAVLVHDRKAPVRLVLIGGATGSSDATNSEFDAQLARQIKRYDLENHLLRTGFVSAPEVSAHLLACDAVVLTSAGGPHMLLVNLTSSW